MGNLLFRKSSNTMMKIVLATFVGFAANKFNDCFTASAGISASCSACYATSAQYSVKNCKVACISKWCSSSCLKCTEPAQDDLAVCTGFTAGSADPCDGLAV